MVRHSGMSTSSPKRTLSKDCGEEEMLRYSPPLGILALLYGVALITDSARTPFIQRVKKTWLSGRSRISYLL